MFEDTKVLFFSHNDGSGFAEMPIVTASGFMPGDAEFDSFVSDFIEANDLTLESLNDDFLTEDEYRQVLIDSGVLDANGNVIKNGSN